MPKLTKNGVPVGNLEKKYNSRNPIYRLLMDNFLRAIKQLLEVRRDEIQSACECGCGEGELAKFIFSFMEIKQFKAFDFSDEIIRIAEKNDNRRQITFYTKNIYDVNDHENADLIICCEALEHLEYPGTALQKLAGLNAKYYLFSVPNEPLWRFLNMLRGKFIMQFGNTPGHLQHWSKTDFHKFLSKYFEIIESASPLPWNIVLCKKHLT